MKGRSFDKFVIEKISLGILLDEPKHLLVNLHLFPRQNLFFTDFRNPLFFKQISIFNYSNLNTIRSGKYCFSRQINYFDGCGY